MVYKLVERPRSGKSLIRYLFYFFYCKLCSSLFSFLKIEEENFSVPLSYITLHFLVFISVLSMSSL